MKVRPEGDELFRAYGRADSRRDKLVVAFRSLAKAPKNGRRS